MRDFILDRRGKLIIHFIGRYENMPVDWSAILRQFQLEPVALPYLKGTRTRREELASVRTTEDFDLILAKPIWRGNLKSFGYDI